MFQEDKLWLSCTGQAATYLACARKVASTAQRPPHAAHLLLQWVLKWAGNVGEREMTVMQPRSKAPHGTE
jgi:hypothetical protein